MAKPLLLLDSNYLCHRAHYSTGELSCGDYRTGVIFGFLRTVIELQDRFLPGAIAFCFDKGPILRELDYPEYKEARREKYRNMTEEERVSKEYMDEQIRDLRTKSRHLDLPISSTSEDMKETTLSPPSAKTSDTEESEKSSLVTTTTFINSLVKRPASTPQDQRELLLRRVGLKGSSELRRHSGLTLRQSRVAGQMAYKAYKESEKRKQRASLTAHSRSKRKQVKKTKPSAPSSTETVSGNETDT
jgi:hypothetical protein